MQRALGIGLVALAGSGCTTEGGEVTRGFIRVSIVEIDGLAPPTADAPLPANLGNVEERWSFTAEVIGQDGERDTSFDGVARVSMVPGSVNLVEGDGADGRNIRFSAGQAEGVAVATAMFGPARLWIQDIGYRPADPGEVPACSNGKDDDDDIVNDFPNDPGCAFADDTSEEDGSLITGVSPVVHYSLPTIADVQGRSSATPFPSVAVEIASRSPASLVVTRVSSDGFYVTDLNNPVDMNDEPIGYNHLYAFNFNVPAGMRVCNRVSALSGTASEFFGFTEISFPSYEIGTVSNPGGKSCTMDRDPEHDDADPEDKGCAPGDFCERLGFETVGVCQPCLVPEPVELTNDIIISDVEMEKLESGLVTVTQVRISPFFGPNVPDRLPDGTFGFSSNASNCDVNGDGRIDFFEETEALCANQCSANVECSEWLGFASRGNYKVAKGSVSLQINTGTAQGFDPVKHKGRDLARVTGTLRNFSGGNLNWTVETRCSEDLVCGFDEVCQTMPVPANTACIRPATEDDNDAGTN